MGKFTQYLVEGSDKENKAMEEIMDFFADNPAPPDEDVHDLAEKLGINTHKFEAYIYKILGSILGTGEAKKEKFTEKEANTKQLAMGIEVEMEHTKNKAIAKRIALDHLAELPDYYSRLKKMEGGH